MNDHIVTPHDSEPAIVVYIGEDSDQKGKIIYAYAEVLEKSILSPTIYFAKKVHPYAARPGSLFNVRVERSDSGIVRSIYGQNAEFAGRFEDEEKITEWEIKHRLTQILKASKKESSTDLLSEALEPVRKVYQESTRHERSLILAEIIRIITG